MTPSLRDRLRDETASLHAAVARAVAGTGCLDAPLPGPFLAFQARALAGFAPDGGGTGTEAIGGPDPETARARRLHRAIRAALRADLGRDFPAPASGPVVSVPPTAFVYVMLGSGAGISLLAPRWPSAGHFLRLSEGFRRDWSDLAGRLGACPAEGTFADRVILGARAVFAGFVVAAGTSLRTAAHD
jgi:hypothetical protein